MFRLSGFIAFILLSASAAIAADGALVSMTSRGSLFSGQTVQPLVPTPAAFTKPPATSALPDQPRHGARGSLFIGDGADSLLSRSRILQPNSAMSDRRSPARVRIRNVIALAEAGPAGYDAVVYAARIKTPKPPTSMTLAEIFDWIRATPKQHHAIGRYQFIPKTLQRLVDKAGLPGNTRFNPAVQDQLADILLDEAGFHEMIAGDLSVGAYQNHLARIWAGLPLENGKSYYQGYAGNKATITRARFDQAMQGIGAG